MSDLNDIDATHRVGHRRHRHRRPPHPYYRITLLIIETAGSSNTPPRSPPGARCRSP